MSERLMPGMWHIKPPMGILCQVENTSAATVISLGAKTTVIFSEETPGESGGLGTQLLFHCAYIRGETECDGRATERLSEALAKFTARTSKNWYNYLIENTTPATVERVLLSELLDEQWNCTDAMFSGTTCIRQHSLERNSTILYQELVSLMYPHGFPTLIEGNEFLGSRLHIDFFSDEVNFGSIQTSFGLSPTHGSQRNSLCELRSYGIEIDGGQFEVNLAGVLLIDFTGAEFRVGRDGRSIALKGADLEINMGRDGVASHNIERALNSVIVGDYERTQLMLLPYSGKDPEALVGNLNRSADICEQLKQI